MVVATFGSSIETGWNRLSSAASFPIVFRYSSAMKIVKILIDISNRWAYVSSPLPAEGLLQGQA